MPLLIRQLPDTAGDQILLLLCEVVPDLLLDQLQHIVRDPDTADITLACHHIFLSDHLWYS